MSSIANKRDDRVDNNHQQQQQQANDTSRDVVMSSGECNSEQIDLCISIQDVDSVLQEITAYSSANQSSLERGHLWLTTGEAEKLAAVMKVLDLSSHWGFVEIPDTPQHEKYERKSIIGSSKKSKKKSTTASSLPKRKSGCADGTTFMRSVVSPPKERAHHSREKAMLFHKAAKSRQLKNLPDWGRRLHRITMHLCQIECAKPFTREAAPTDHDYATIFDSIQPGIVPMGLTSVLSKLEHGLYTTPLEVFNDIYLVWLSAYRTHPPGSPLWIQAHEASKTFLQQIANEPIRDDFTPPGSLVTPGGSTYGNEDNYNPGRPSTGASPLRKKRPPSTNVDKLFQEFLEKHEGNSSKVADTLRRTSSSGSWSSATATTLSRPKKRCSRGFGKRQARNSAGQVTAPPITQQERETFQTYLSQLQTHHHLMLYEAFRRTAVWRAMETGEVELDDVRTSPQIFRKMIAWCKSQIAVQPSLQHQRINTSDTSSSSMPLTPGIPGSGKIVPGMDASSGGKLGAKSFLDSRPSEPMQPKYSSSSSSSPSSSSDEGSSSEDDDHAGAPVHAASSVHAAAPVHAPAPVHAAARPASF